MSNRFEGKSVLVAGGTGGLGRAVSLAFLNESARVTVTYRSANEFAELKTAADKRASALAGRDLDVTDDAAVQRLVQEMLSHSGRLDVMVNTVGGYAGGTPLWQTDWKVFDTQLALNLRSGFVLSRAVVPVMLKQASGAIVSIASRAAIDHAAGAAAYVASKAASVAMFDSLAADLKGTGVRANSVLPSIIDTAANRRAMPNADFAKWPKAEEVASVILFLASDEAKLIHGASVPVYGSS